MIFILFITLNNYKNKQTLHVNLVCTRPLNNLVNYPLLSLIGPHPLFSYKPGVLIKMKSLRFSTHRTRRNMNTDNSNSIINQFLNFTPQFSFENLETGYEEIKFSLLGVAGIYRLTNKRNPQRFYIGSTVNLSRRILEYLNLTKGIRTPKSSSELEFSNFSAWDWKLEILKLTTPQLALVLEQYALIRFNPTINKNLKVVPRVNKQWGNLDNAIEKIKIILTLFDKDSFGYTRFQVFLKTYLSCNELFNYPTLNGKTRLSSEISESTFSDSIDDKYYSNLVFVYVKNVLTQHQEKGAGKEPYNNPVVYSSINKAIKALSVTYETIMNCVINQYLLKNTLCLSFEPITSDIINNYRNKPISDNLLRKHILLFNTESIDTPVFEFKSGRDMAKYFKIDGKKARAAIKLGTYQDFTIVSKDIPYRKEIYVLDKDTLTLITKFNNQTDAQKYAKINFYKLKTLLESNEPYNGQIFSYNYPLISNKKTPSNTF